MTVKSVDADNESASEQQTIVTELTPEGKVRLEVIQSLLEPCDRVTYGQRLRDGSQKLDISVRSIQRLFKKYQEQGLIALITTERADRGQHRISTSWQEFILNTYKTGNKGSRRMTPKQVAIQVQAQAKKINDSEPPSYRTVLRVIAPIQERAAEVKSIRSPGWRGSTLSVKTRDGYKFKKRCRKAQIKAERLKMQVESRRPLGRDLTNDRWINTLLTAASTMPQDDSEAMAWQNQLLQQHPAVPYPVALGNEDLFWSKDSNGRLCIKFNGLGSSHTFKIYCDQRQLKWLERFYQDREVKRHSKENGKDKHTSALFTLRSGMLAWQEQQGKEEPWQKNRLTLSCSLDTRFWSAEGTEIIRQQKAIEVKEILAKMEDKADLTKKQEAFVSKKQSTLDRLNNPFPRPHQPFYCGQPNLILSVSMILEKPATVAIVNTITGKAITYRSFRQLLGDEYHLFNSQCKQKQRLSHLRKNAQRKHQIIHAIESELGQYIDRLIAKSIVELAMAHQVGSIVLPALTNIREIVESEIKVRAEAKIPGCIEAQKQYAKEYRMSIHRWSHARLKDSIQSQASQHNIPVEIVKQPILIKPVEIAGEMAKIAYEQRCVP